MVNTHRYNWYKQNLYSHYLCCLLITRNNSLVYIFMFHSSRTQASDKLPWNSIQRNSSHSKITESSLLPLLKIVHEILISIELWVCFLSWFSYKTLPQSWTTRETTEAPTAGNQILGQNAAYPGFCRSAGSRGSYWPQYQHPSWLVKQKLCEVLHAF